jgi:hypothetical protein
MIPNLGGVAEEGGTDEQAREQERGDWQLNFLVRH